MIRCPFRNAWFTSGIEKSTSVTLPGVNGSGFSQLFRNFGPHRFAAQQLLISAQMHRQGVRYFVYRVRKIIIRSIVRIHIDQLHDKSESVPVDAICNFGVTGPATRTSSRSGSVS